MKKQEALDEGISEFLVENKFHPLTDGLTDGEIIFFGTLELFNSYREFCKFVGRKPLPRSDFKNELIARGFDYLKSSTWLPPGFDLYRHPVEEFLILDIIPHGAKSGEAVNEITGKYIE